MSDPLDVPLDLLIHRHLDGTLGDDDAKMFQERLRADADARRRLAEMAFEHAQLKEILEPAKRAKPTSPAWHWVAAASILVAVAVALVVGPFRGETPAVTPPSSGAPAKAVAASKKREGYQGFLGRVHARVLDRKDKVRLQLKVGEVLAVRDASEAAAPEDLVREAISIPMPRLKDGEPPGPDRDHAAFLTKLMPGQEVVLEIRHLEGADFAIVALTQEQANWARKDDRKKTPPKEGPKEGVKEGQKDPPKKTDKEER
ncbi:MAG TPA: hypothetical protein VF950_07930 [Planctomycetota bacterium]